MATKGLWCILIFHALLIAVCKADTTIQLCDSDSPVGGSASSVYTDYIKYLYGQGLSTLPLTMPDDCDQLDILDSAVDFVFNVGNADAGKIEDSKYG